jgi:tetratricopeptide (TPR) repeat protein
MFLQGLRLLSQGNGREAGSIFHSLATYAKQDNLMFPLYEAISYEMAEEEFEAEKIFYSPSLQTEAGTFLHILTYHKEIVEDLKKIHQTTDPHTRANLYSLIAIYYRQMGYTGAVDTMFRRSLAADPKFYPTLIFSAIYDWQDGKYDAARLYCKKAAASDSANPLTKKIQKILDEEDILQHAAPGERPALLIQQANDLINAGMREDAIDRLLLLLHEQSQDRDAQKMLADLYLVKQRYAPAEQLYRSLLAADPQNASIRHQLSLLEQRR